MRWVARVAARLAWVPQVGALVGEQVGAQVIRALRVILDNLSLRIGLEEAEEEAEVVRPEPMVGQAPQQAGTRVGPVAPTPRVRQEGVEELLRFMVSVVQEEQAGRLDSRRVHPSTVLVAVEPAVLRQPRSTAVVPVRRGTS